MARRVREALGGSIAVDRRVLNLRGRVAALMGEEDAERAFSLIGPRATRVRIGDVEFSWKAPPEATAFVVTVVDDTTQEEAAISSPLNTRRWRPPSGALKAGRTYRWYVVARVSGREIQAPVAPDPVAKFQTIDPVGEAMVAKAEREHAKDPLLLALTYAEAGLMRDAERMLTALREQNPDSLVVWKLQERLRAARRPRMPGVD
jgi:hypothetical protein